LKNVQVDFNVNGRKIMITSAPNRTLLDVLREDLGLTGAKDACGGEGECGACTVLMDEKLVNSCMVLVGQVDGSSILTIEGISELGEFHPLQKASVEVGAVQCGYCTPGFIMSATALLKNNAEPTAMWLLQVRFYQPKLCWIKILIHPNKKFVRAFQEIYAGVQDIARWLPPFVWLQMS